MHVIAASRHPHQVHGEFGFANPEARPMAAMSLCQRTGKWPGSAESLNGIKFQGVFPPCKPGREDFHVGIEGL